MVFYPSNRKLTNTGEIREGTVGEGTDPLGPGRCVGTLQASLGKGISGLGIECARAWRHIWGIVFCLIGGDKTERRLQRCFSRMSRSPDAGNPRHKEKPKL